MPTYIINSFIGGIADYENEGIKGSFKTGKNLNIHRNVNSLYCQQKLSDDLSAGTMTGVTISIITADDGYTYFFNRDGKIYRRDSNGAYTLVYTDSDGVIKGAWQWYNNVGSTFLTWATDTKLRRKQILSGTTPVNTNWSDVDATINSQSYPKTLSSSDDHTMRDINGALYICNDNKIAMVGYDDTFTSEALQLIPGNRAKTLIEDPIVGAIIGCKRKDAREESYLIDWDTLSLNWNAKHLVSTASVNAVIGGLGLAQVGSNGKVFYLGDLSKPLFSFPGGGQVNPYGVDVDDGLYLFGVYGNGTDKTGIYSYGTKMQNADYTLNLEYQFDCDEIGAVKKVGSTVLFSYKNGSSYGVKKVDLTAKATAVYGSLDLEAPVDTKKEPVWTTVRIVTAPMPSGTSISLRRKTDKSGEFTQANMEGGDIVFSIADATEALFLIGDAGKYIEVEITLTPVGNTSPEVYRVEVDFK